MHQGVSNHALVYPEDGGVPSIAWKPSANLHFTLNHIQDPGLFTEDRNETAAPPARNASCPIDL